MAANWSILSSTRRTRPNSKRALKIFPLGPDQPADSRSRASPEWRLLTAARFHESRRVRPRMPGDEIEQRLGLADPDYARCTGSVREVIEIWEQQGRAARLGGSDARTVICPGCMATGPQSRSAECFWNQ